MRVALLSVLDSQADQRSQPPAFRMMAGARIVDRQLDMALAAGCETIACLVSSVGREVIDLQHRAEAAGARFIATRDAKKLSGMVTASDELLVLSSGVLPEEEAITRYLTKPAILVFPEDPAVGRGYERIDAHFAWAGAMLVRGQSVEQLAQLPDDVDAPSALLRIALQAGVKTYPLEKRLLDEHAWLKDPTADELSARERSWVAGHAQLAPFTAPGLAVAERMGTRLAKDAIGSSLPRFLAIGSAVAALGALAFAAAGWVLPGFGFATLAMLLFAMEAVVRRIASAGQVRPPVPLLAQAMAILLDPLLLMLIALASPEDTGWLRLFVPAVLLGLLHLGERLSAVRWRRSYADRLTLLAVLMPAVFFGVTQPVVAVLALAVLITLFLTSDARD